MRNTLQEREHVASGQLDLTTRRRFIGVADIANVRFSLPAQLIEPIPNLGTTVERVRKKDTDASQNIGTTSIDLMYL